MGRWTLLTRVAVALEFVAGGYSLGVGNYERGLLFALVGFVIILADESARLRRRITALENTVNEMIES